MQFHNVTMGRERLSVWRVLLAALFLPGLARAQAPMADVKKPLSPPKATGARVLQDGRDPMRPKPVTKKPTPVPTPKAAKTTVKPVTKAAPTTKKITPAKPAPKSAVAKAQPPTKQGTKTTVASGNVRQAVQPGVGVAAGIAAGRTAVRRPVTKKPRPVYLKPVKMVVLDTVDSTNNISTVTDDGRFTSIQVTPDTRLRDGEALLQAVDLKPGMKITCWGKWSTDEPEIFEARGVVITGRLDDYALRLKINEACQKTVRPHFNDTPPPAPAPATTPAAPKPVDPKPTDPKPGTPQPAPTDPNAPKPTAPVPATPQPATPDAPKP